MTTEQKTQAVIDFNKLLESLPASIEHMDSKTKKEVAKYIADRRKELGLEQ